MDTFTKMGRLLTKREETGAQQLLDLLKNPYQAQVNSVSIPVPRTWV